MPGLSADSEGQFRPLRRSVNSFRRRRPSRLCGVALYVVAPVEGEAGPSALDLSLDGARGNWIARGANLQLGSLGKPQLAFNWDGGSAEKLTIGATGGYKLNIKIQGIASHAGNHPEEGVSAIGIAGLAIADLQQNGWHGLIEKNGKQGTSNLGVVQGGEATNVVTDLVTVQAEARSHNTPFRKKIVSEIEKAFHRAAGQLKNVDGKQGQVEFSSQLNYDSFKLKRTEPCVAIAAAAVEQTGGEPCFCVVNGGLDANWTTATWHSYGDLGLRPNQPAHRQRNAQPGRIQQGL